MDKTLERGDDGSFQEAGNVAVARDGCSVQQCNAPRRHRTSFDPVNEVIFTVIFTQPPTRVRRAFQSLNNALRSHFPDHQAGGSRSKQQAGLSAQRRGEEFVGREDGGGCFFPPGDVGPSASVGLTKNSVRGTAAAAAREEAVATWKPDDW